MSMTTEAGYTRAAAGPTVRQRVHSARVALAFIGVFALLVTVMALTRGETNSTPLSLSNPHPDGARALAQVARAQGLEIREIDRLGAARIQDPAQTTLVIAEGYFLQSFQASSILGYPGDIVVFGSAEAIFGVMGLGLYDVTWSRDDVLTASCPDPDATAAGTIRARDWAISGTLPADAVGCFPIGQRRWQMVTVEDQGRTITVIADALIVTNDRIAQEGNAALALRTIGASPQAVWYLGSPYDSSTLTWLAPGEGGPGGGATPGPVTATPDFLPPGTGNVLYACGVALVVVVLWRARRFGPLVREPLPVVIRSSEATRGRARLYRAAAAYGRAGASLRAASATRLGRRLGVPRHDDGAALVTAIARATGRPLDDVRQIFHGPLPQSEQAMMDLAAALDQLEGEVHPS